LDQAASYSDRVNVAEDERLTFDVLWLVRPTWMTQ
jgi:hypothetical protein